MLLRCGAPKPQLPADLAGAPVITTPVRSIYSESTTQLPMIVESGALDALTGVATPDFVSTPEVVARIKAGAVKGFEADGQLNAESVITAAPDVLLSQGTDNPAFPAIRSAGIPVIGWADYLDSSPLGQAEWIKVMGALTGHEEDAARVYGEIEQRYADVVAKVRSAGPVPVVVGSLYQGTWSVPAGGSTAGALFRDAGATWSEAANPAAGTVSKSFESVFAGDGAAGIWLANGPFPTRASIVAADARYGELAAVRSGQVWTRDKRTGAGGGNDVFERGVTHPDEVLADLAQVVHPQLLPGRELVYYRQVAA
ncbi:ABC transporter substrate-binding protein [Pseudonocardia sp. GCM10023141]